MHYEYGTQNILTPYIPRAVDVGCQRQYILYIHYKYNTQEILTPYIPMAVGEESSRSLETHAYSMVCGVL